MIYSDRELKNASIVAYANFSDLIEKIPNYNENDTIETLIGRLKNYPELEDSFKQLLELKSENSVDWQMIKSWKIVTTRDKNAYNGFYGCLIEIRHGDAIVAFRGSEDMKKLENLKNDWINADFRLLNSTLTTQQEEAEKFMKTISEYYKDRYDNFGVTGHSLGGNLAEHATITSHRYGLADKIKQCVSFDGPGFSDEYIRKYREYILAMSGKMKHFQWSFVGNILQRLPSVEFVTLNATCNDPVKRHSLKYIEFDENWKAIPGEMDRCALLAGWITKGIDFMPTIIGDAIVAILSSLLIVIPLINGKIFDEKGNLTNFGLGIIISMLKVIFNIGIHGIILFIGKIAIFIIAFLAVTILIGLAYEMIEAIVKTVVEAIEKAWNWTADRIVEFKNYINNLLNDFKNWWEKTFNAGFKYASANPEILVDTNKLKSYADRLNKVNLRISDVERQIRSLWMSVSGIEDLFLIYDALDELVKSLGRISSTYKVRKCANYLEYTARDFEAVERNILLNSIKI